MPKRGRYKGREFAGLNTRFVVGYLQDKAPAGACEEVLQRAEDTRTLEQLMDPNLWSSYAEFRRLLEATSAVLGLDVFDEVGRYPFDAVASPEIIEAILAFGSPGAWLTNSVGIVSAMTPALEVINEELGPMEWMVRIRLKDGYEMFPELCRYIFALNATVPLIFGHQPIPTTDDACQSHGAEYCIRVLRWTEVDQPDDSPGNFGFRLQLFEARLEALQQTLKELVSGEGLDFVLPRIVAAAARAVQAPAYVLAIEDPSTSQRHVYYEGIDAEEAAIYLDPRMDAVAISPNALAVTVASGRCRYGHLVAIRSTEGRFHPPEISSLEGYASLAAVALDSASAIDDARRQASMATALLNLSNSLEKVTNTEELAERLVQAVPLVVDCDRVVVTLVDETETTARAVAVYGYEPKIETKIRELIIPIESLGPTSTELEFHQPRSDGSNPTGTPRLDSGSLLTATLPIKKGDQLLGWITADVTERPERLTNSPDLEWRLQGLAGQAAIAIANARLVDEIRHQALHDHLTGLPNRMLVADRTDQMLARARRYMTDIALLFIDLDGFKDVNDTLGHEAGDELLKAVASRFRAVTRSSDTIGRLGGDEFVVLAEGTGLMAGPELVAERLIEALSQPFHIGRDAKSLISISASIGIAVGLRDSTQELMRDADVALYAAKAAGKKCAIRFEPHMQLAVQRHHELETDLRSALETSQYFLVYQPVLDLCSMDVLGCEALLRWEHPTRGVINPDGFISILEETGMIVEVGEWVLIEACRQVRTWLDQGHAINVSVNVSGRQLAGHKLVEQVMLALQRYAIEPGLLTIEITETVLMQDTDGALKQLEALKEIGVRIAIDDFGTGHSSLAYINRFPVDVIKIDRTFITGMSESPDGRALIQTFVQLGKTLSIEIVAEGIEDNSQLALLQAEHCDSGQGYLFARPLRPDAIEWLLRPEYQTESVP